VPHGAPGRRAGRSSSRRVGPPGFRFGGRRFRPDDLLGSLGRTSPGQPGTTTEHRPTRLTHQPIATDQTLRIAPHGQPTKEPPLISSPAAEWARTCPVPYRGGHISPHSLRHAAITNALDTGVPPRDAQILARHADPRTTEHYDRARGNLDRHGVHFLTAYVAGVCNPRPFRPIWATGPCAVPSPTEPSWVRRRVGWLGDLRGGGHARSLPVELFVLSSVGGSGRQASP